MPLYRYEATDRSGKIMRGVMNAADETAVAARLGNMGYAVRSVVTAQSGQQPAATAVQTQIPQQRQSTPMFPASVEPIVKLSVLAKYYRQLAVLVRSGMHLAQSVSELSAATRNTKLREATDVMQSQVQAGASLSSAMASYPLLFPVHTVGLIWAGEQGGYLDVALEEAASELEQESKDNRVAGIGWFIAKLNIASLILALPVWDVEAFLTKVTTSMMAKPTGDNPLGSVDITGAIKTIGVLYMQGFLKLSIPALIAWIILSYVWGKLKRNPNVRRSIDSMLLAAPNWGKFHASRSRERFLKTLKKQYEAGVSPAQSWAAASMTVRNSEYARRLRGLESIMRQPNGSLRDALVQSRVFSIEDSNMVGSGEKAGSIPEMLERLADHHNSIHSTAKTAGRVIATNALIFFLMLPTLWLAVKMMVGFMKVGGKFGGIGS